jgi:hypothetical protein
MSELSITKAIFIRTGTYNPMYRRAMTTSDISGNVISQLQQVTNNGNSITPANLSSVASQIIAPSATPESTINIQGGFDQPKYRFLIEATLSTGLNAGRMRKIITGYTDHYWLGQKHDPRFGLFEQNMQLIVNNVISLRDVDIPTPQGVITQTTIADSDQILFGTCTPGFSGQRDFLVRAEDVYRHAQLPALLNSSNNYGSKIFNATSSFQDGIVKSNRNNNVPTSYLSKMLNANKQAVDNSTTEMDTLPELFSRAMGYAQENTIQADSVLTWFTDLGNFTQNASIFWGELCRRCPGIIEIASVLNPDAASISTRQHHTGATEYWHGTGPHVSIATEIALALPSMMMDNAIGSCAFVYSNRVLPGDIPELHWVKPEATSLVQGIDYTPYLHKLKNRFMHEIVPGITRGGNLDITLHVHCSIFNETTIAIGIGGGEAVHFKLPTFCDSLFSPMITANAALLDGASQTFTNIYDHLNNSSMVSNSLPQTMSFAAPQYAPMTYQQPTMAAAPTFGAAPMPPAGVKSRWS